MSNENGNKEKDSACGCGGRSCCSGPGKWIWLLLAAAIIVIVIARNVKQPEAPAPVNAIQPAQTDAAASAQVAPTAAAAKGQSLPRLVDLGATKCIPCKMMAPILEDLKKTYAGKMDVQFIDVWANPDAGGKYGIKVIPTQIFYDAAGKELFRHEGFFSKEDILTKWKELGIELNR